jgi:DNA-binding CsgD family transcriptional regulator
MGAKSLQKWTRYLPMIELQAIQSNATKSPKSASRLHRPGLASGSVFHRHAAKREAPRRSRNQSQTLRNTGLSAVGDVPWGTHFSIFYETKRDLLEIVVPFFEAGLQANEFCLWIVASSELLTISEAKAVLHEALPDFDRLLKNGNIEIVQYEKWFLTGRAIDIPKAIARIRQKVNQAVNSGFSGARLTGSPTWMRNNLRAQSFREYEHKLDGQLAREPVIVACTFPLRLAGAEDILDAARTHQFALTVRKGAWKRVEIADIESAKREARRTTSPELEQLTFRQREILQLVAKGQNTKQIADLLGISVKTVEAHRLQLMRRLKIHNVAGLVRFAIRTGLVSPED